MNISINCKLSLSKKLRAILGKEASLTLVSQDIVDGRGTAILSLASEGISGDVKPEEIGETSIQLIPVEIAEDSPTSQSPVHASIFSTVLPKGHKSPVVKKIAAVNPPEEGEEASAIKEKVEVPSAFSDLKDKECEKWINDMEGLIAVANVSRSKQSSIDLSTAQNDRERAVLLEIKEKEESIGVPAWIVNDKAGMLTVNDLNISLPLNSPFDLGNISAKRIIASKDLKILLREGYVRFISPKEKDELVVKHDEKEENEVSLGLEVFDRHEEAMDNMSAGSGKKVIIDEENTMDITEGDIESPTEDESMMINLTQNMPTKKSIPSVSGGSRKTVHGNSSPASAPKSPSIKPIRKLV